MGKLMRKIGFSARKLYGLHSGTSLPVMRWVNRAAIFTFIGFLAYIISISI